MNQFLERSFDFTKYHFNKLSLYHSKTWFKREYGNDFLDFLDFLDFHEFLEVKKKNDQFSFEILVNFLKGNSEGQIRMWEWRSRGRDLND